MKKSSIFIFIICICNYSYSQSSGDFMHFNELVRGQVFRIYQTTMHILPGDSPHNPQKSEFDICKIINYNSRRECLSIQEMSPQEYFKPVTEYSYNAQSKPVAGKITYGSGEAAVNLTFSYDDKGQLSATRAIDVKGGTVLQEQSYNYLNGYLEIVQKNHGMFPAQYRQRVERGILVESTRLDIAGKAVEIATYQYHPNGFLSQIITKDSTGQEINRVNFTYELDEKGNWTKELSYDQRTDRYKLRTQTIIYQGQKDRIPNEKELQGIWHGWIDKNAWFFLNGTDAGLKTEKLTIKNDHFTYSAVSGGFQLLDLFKQQCNFNASFDGKVLTLRQVLPERVFYFIRDKQQDLDIREMMHDYLFLPTSDFLSFKVGNSHGLKMKNGKIILNAQYEETYPVTNQILIAKKKGKWALFNRQGKQITPFRFREVNRAAWKYLTCVDSIRVLYSPDGKEILKGPFNKMKVLPGKVVWVSQIMAQEERFGVFDLQGKEILPVEFSRLEFLDETGTTGAVATRGDKKTIWFDKNFKEIRTFTGYPKIKPLGNDIYKLDYGKSEGLLDSAGNTILEPVYEDMRFISAHFLAAQKDRKTGLINTSGKEMTPFVYDNILSENLKDEILGITFDITRHQSSALFVKEDGFGYLNGYGKEVKPMLTLNPDGDLFSKVFEIPGRAIFRYSLGWKQEGNILYAGKQKGNAIVMAKEVIYSGDLLLWLQQKYRENDWRPLEIAGKQAYSFIKIQNAQTMGLQQETKSQKIVIPLDQTAAIEISLDCATYFYPHVAQDFFNMVYTLSLKN